MFSIQQQTRIYYPTSTMGVSISKSTAYTEMIKKSKNRSASKPKDLFQKNMKVFIEGQHVGKQNQKQTQNSVLAKTLHAKQTIDNLAHTSKKSIDMQMGIENNQKLNSEEQFAESSANQKLMSSLKKSLHLPQKSTNQDNFNSDPMDQFSNVETLSKKNSKAPSCLSIRTKKDINIPASIPQQKNTFSGKSLSSRGKVQYASNPVSCRNIDEQSLSGNEWRSVEESMERNKDYRQCVGFKSITLSNKFAQMGSHMHERENCESINNKKHVISTKIFVGSRHTKPI